MDGRKRGIRNGDGLQIRVNVKMIRILRAKCLLSIKFDLGFRLIDRSANTASAGLFKSLPQLHPRAASFSWEESD